MLAILFSNVAAVVISTTFGIAGVTVANNELSSEPSTSNEFLFFGWAETGKPKTVEAMAINQIHLSVTGEQQRQ